MKYWMLLGGSANHNAIDPIKGRPSSKRIPSLGGQGCRRFSDDDIVTALVLDELKIPRVKIAEAIGCAPGTIATWKAGTTRAHFKMPA